MVKLTTLKRSGQMRENGIFLRPIMRNKTWWSSTYEMLQRYHEIQDRIPKEDSELLCMLLSDEEENCLSQLLGSLKMIESITKELQKGNEITLSETR